MFPFAAFGLEVFNIHPGEAGWLTCSGLIQALVVWLLLHQPACPSQQLTVHAWLRPGELRLCKRTAAVSVRRSQAHDYIQCGGTVVSINVFIGANSGGKIVLTCHNHFHRSSYLDNECRVIFILSPSYMSTALYTFIKPLCLTFLYTFPEIAKRFRVKLNRFILYLIVYIPGWER